MSDAISDYRLAQLAAEGFALSGADSIRLGRYALRLWGQVAAPQQIPRVPHGPSCKVSEPCDECRVTPEAGQ